MQNIKKVVSRGKSDGWTLTADDLIERHEIINQLKTDTFKYKSLDLQGIYMGGPNHKDHNHWNVQEISEALEINTSLESLALKFFYGNDMSLEKFLFPAVAKNTSLKTFSLMSNGLKEHIAYIFKLNSTITTLNLSFFKDSPGVSAPSVENFFKILADCKNSSLETLILDFTQHEKFGNKHTKDLIDFLKENPNLKSIKILGDEITDGKLLTQLPQLIKDCSHLIEFELSSLNKYADTKSSINTILAEHQQNAIKQQRAFYQESIEAKELIGLNTIVNLNQIHSEIAASRILPFELKSLANKKTIDYSAVIASSDLLNEKREICSMCLLDEKYLVTGDQQSQIYITNLESKTSYKLNSPHTLRVTGLVAIDKKTFASCGDGKEGDKVTVWEWNGTQARIKNQFNEHWLTDLKVHNGLLYAVYAAGLVFRINPQANAEPEKIIEVEGKTSHRLEVLSENEFIIGNNYGVFIYDIKKQTSTALTEADIENCHITSTGDFPSSVYEITLSPDKKKLATVGYDRILRIYDLEHTQKQCIKSFSLPDDGYAVTFLPDGRIATGYGGTQSGNQIRIFDIYSGQKEPVAIVNTKHASGIHELLVLPDGRLISGGQGTQPSIQMWEFSLKSLSFKEIDLIAEKIEENTQLKNSNEVKQSLLNDYSDQYEQHLRWTFEYYSAYPWLIDVKNSQYDQALADTRYNHVFKILEKILSINPDFSFTNDDFINLVEENSSIKTEIGFYLSYLYSYLSAHQSNNKTVLVLENIALLIPIKEGDHENTKLLLDKSNEPAALKTKIQTIQSLLTKSIDLAAVKAGWTPLHCAASYKHIGIMELLLEETLSQDINALTPLTQETPLHLAVKANSLSAVQLLVKKGAIIDKADYQGDTPALLAKKQRPEIYKWLQKEQLFLAAKQNNLEKIKVIYQKFKSDAVIAVDDEGYSALHLAAKYGNTDLIEGLLDMGWKKDQLNIHNQQTPLHIAIYSNNRGIVEILLASGADLEIAAVMPGFDKPMRPVELAVMLGNQVLADLLIEKGAKFSNYLLEIAIKFNHISLIDHLINKHQLKPTQVLDDSNRTPLMVAAFLGRNEIIIRLVNYHKVELNNQDIQWKTALHWAVEGDQGETINLLFCLGANFQLADKDGKNPENYAEKLGYTHLKNKINNLPKMPDYKIEFTQPENLVFQGGSVKGIAYVGALTVLHQKYNLRTIKRVAGTSAGAITAMLLAVGYLPNEIHDELKKLVFKSFLDSASQADFLDINELAKHLDEPITWDNLTLDKLKKIITSPVKLGKLIYGFSTQSSLFPGETFREWADDMLKAKYGKANLTFGELAKFKETQKGKELGVKDLFVVATKINTASALAEIVEFSSANPECDDIIISSAVRCSMSIPGMFEPCHLYYKRHGAPIKDTTALYVDGGILRNYPIDIFDKYIYLRSFAKSAGDAAYTMFNQATLGFRLLSAEQINIFNKRDPQMSKPLSNSLKFMQTLLDAISDHENAHALLRGNDPVRTIYINHHNISITEFNLLLSQQDLLIETGEKAVKKFFDEKTTSYADKSLCKEVKALTYAHPSQQNQLNDIFEEIVPTQNLEQISIIKEPEIEEQNIDTLRDKKERVASFSNDLADTTKEETPSSIKLLINRFWKIFDYGSAENNGEKKKSSSWFNFGAEAITLDGKQDNSFDENIEQEFFKPFKEPFKLSLINHHNSISGSYSISSFKLNDTQNTTTKQQLKEPLGRPVNYSVALTEQIIFGNYIGHYVKKYSPFTFPWNKLHAITSTEHVKLKTYQLRINHLIHIISDQKLSLAGQSGLFVDKFDFCDKSFHVVQKMIRMALESNKITDAQLNEIQSKINRIEEHIHIIAQHNKTLKKFAIKEARLFRRNQNTGKQSVVINHYNPVAATLEQEVQTIADTNMIYQPLLKADNKEIFANCTTSFVRSQQFWQRCHSNENDESKQITQQDVLNLFP